MKYAISLMLTINAWASPIVVFHENAFPHAEAIKMDLIEEYQIPSELIELKKITRCEEAVGRGKLDLCLKNNGDLEVVSVDKEFVVESLRIFRAP